MEKHIIKQATTKIECQKGASKYNKRVKNKHYVKLDTNLYGK